MKPKILFINPNFQSKIKAISQITIGPPLGMAYLAAVLEKKGFNVRILDANVHGLNIKQIIKNVKDFSPDLIGLSAVTPTIKQVANLAQIIKQNFPKIKIILGGVHVSTLPKDTLKRFPIIDIGVLNEGENIISQLCKNILKNKSLDKISGIVYKINNKIIVNSSTEFIKDLDSVPFPARHLLPMQLYRSVVSDKFTTMIAMRGCYAKCNYCAVPFFSGNIIRRRSIKNIIKEMIECYDKFNITHFSFLDDTFTTNKKWVHEFCDVLINSELNKKITWMCLTRVDSVDEILFIHMKKSGCIKVEMGIESGSQKILDFSKKGLKKEQIKKAFFTAKKVGLPTLGFIIINMPLEDENTIKETKEFILELDPNFLQVSFATPYPGTDLEKYAIKNKLWIEKDWSKYIFLKNITMENKNISRKKLMKLKQNLELSFYLRPKYLFNLLVFTIKFKTYKSMIWSIKNGLKEIFIKQ